MGDKWIVSDHRFRLHDTIESAKEERKRINKVNDKKKQLWLYRVKTTLQQSGSYNELYAALRNLVALIQKEAVNGEATIFLDDPEVNKALRLLPKLQSKHQADMTEFEEDVYG